MSALTDLCLFGPIGDCVIELEISVKSARRDHDYVTFLAIHEGDIRGSAKQMRASLAQLDNHFEAMIRAATKAREAIAAVTEQQSEAA